MLSNRQLFFAHLAQTSTAPLAIEIERAEGCHLYTPDGGRYLDLISGIAVSNLGHCHPAVVQAVQQQAARYMHLMVYGELVQGPQVQLAAALAATLPPGLDNVYLVNSGAEAVEGAIKLARRYTGRPQVISCHNAYHGSTIGALSAMGSEYFKQAYRPLVPGHRNVRFGVLEDLDFIDHRTAAILIEPIQGEAGVRMAANEYWQALYQRCQEVGALLILDEIQTGMGRTGTLWAFEQLGIVPHILLSAKGLGGGMPIGAFISSKEIMHSLADNPYLGHITTFGGHPVSAAAALATVNVITQQQLYKRAARLEAIMRQGLAHLPVELRGRGLMMAVQLRDFDQVLAVLGRAMQQGVMSDWFLFCSDSIRLAPPLIISEGELAWGIDVLADAIAATELRKG